MSEAPRPDPDPDAAARMREVSRSMRRKVGPAKIALAVVLATVITAVTFGVLSLILWGLAAIFH